MVASLRMPPPSSQATPTDSTMARTPARFSSLALAGAVQIDQVEVLGPQGDPVPCHGGRVLAEDGFPLVVALLEADAFPPAQVNGRPDFHPCSRSCLERPATSRNT